MFLKLLLLFMKLKIFIRFKENFLILFGFVLVGFFNWDGFFLVCVELFFVVV